MSDKYIVTSTYIHFQITDYDPNFSDIIIIVVIFTTLMNFQIILYVYIYITLQYYSMVNVQILSRATLSRFRVCIIFAQFLPFFPSTCIFLYRFRPLFPNRVLVSPRFPFLFSSQQPSLLRESYTFVVISLTHTRVQPALFVRDTAAVGD